MTRLRLLFVGLVVLGSLGWAAPAGAIVCGPEENPKGCCADDINEVWKKITGSDRDLIFCST